MTELTTGPLRASVFFFLNLLYWLQNSQILHEVRTGNKIYWTGQKLFAATYATSIAFMPFTEVNFILKVED